MTIETVDRRADKLQREAFEYLKKASEETIFYIVLGKCLRRELAEKYCLTEDHAGGLLSRVAVNLVDAIKEL